jgi:copper(I)-binding protein
VGLQQPLLAGKSVPLTLEFRVAGAVTVELNVETADPASAVDHTHHR